jgi:O-antigen ligase
VTVAGRSLRVLVGGIVAWWVIAAIVAPEVPRLAAGSAVAVAAVTLWNPAAGLLLVAALTPAGALFAAAPVRAAEIFAWAFLAVWLLGVWRPISPAPLPRTVMIPALLYGAALLASWLMLTMRAAAGVSIVALPQFLFHSIPPDHLIFSSPEPETWTLLQMTTGVALLLASMATIAADGRAIRALGSALAISIGALAAATVADVVRQWSGMNYEGWFVLRYFHGERFSLHLADFNAAGSLYVLAAIVAAAVAALDRGRRGLAIVVLVAIAPAFWLTGSRTSFVAAVVGLLTLAVAQQRRPLKPVQLTAAAVSMSVLAVAGAATVDWQSDVQGSAARSAQLRSQFTETSARMFASAPVFGVGVGRYFDRSAEFMPAELRSIYGNENAHNYFAQQFAELGVVGGVLFVWLAGAVMALGWAAMRISSVPPALETGHGQGPTGKQPRALAGYQEQSPWLVGLFAAVGAYLLTCLTGHPLLVPEAAFPWWIAAGALAGAAERTRGRWSAAQRALIAVTGVVLASGLAREATGYAGATVAPPEYGIHGQETAPDGSSFRWMTRHAVIYVPNEMGFVRLRVQAPSLPMTRPLVIETAIAGEVVDRRELPPGRWVSYDIPSRRSASAPFRRVDLRTNQWWTQEVALGMRHARRPITVMIGDVRWLSLGGGR